MKEKLNIKDETTNESEYAHYNHDYKTTYNYYLQKYSLVEYQLDVVDHYNLQLDKVYRLTGRILFKRVLGKVIFFQLYNDKQKIQLMAQKDSSYDFNLLKKLHRGDIIYAEGLTVLSKTQTLSLFINRWGLISKTLLEHPDKIGGISDGTVYNNKRYLSLLHDKKLRQNIMGRIEIFQKIRNFLVNEGYSEIDTPILDYVYGGALAEPFSCKLADTKKDVFLSIAPELKLKELIFAGFNKIFTITHNFRNEGIDKRHHPQFAALEFYIQNKDYMHIIRFLINLMKEVTLKQKGTYHVLYNGYTINFESWLIIDYEELILNYCNDKLGGMSTNKIKVHLKTLYPDLPELNLEQVKYFLFDNCITPTLIQPTCVINYPVFSTPLAKYNRSNKNYVEQCEIYIAGLEICNIFSEENNYNEIKKIDADSNLNSNFIEMLAYGQPIHGGGGLGLDRFVMLLTNETNILNVLPFHL
jgi:lysyl-tRNA synthetase class 2